MLVKCLSLGEIGISLWYKKELANFISKPGARAMRVGLPSYGGRGLLLGQKSLHQKKKDFNPSFVTSNISKVYSLYKFYR